MNKSLIYAILTVTLLIVISIVMVASSQSNQYLFHRDDFIQDKMYMNDVHILRLVWNQFLYFVRPLFVVIGCTYFAPTLKGKHLCIVLYWIYYVVLFYLCMCYYILF